MTETSNMFQAAVAAIGTIIANFYSHLAPWLLLGMVLVLVDLRYGVMAARVRGEEIRFSRAWRRTINKMIDYLCWVTVAELMSRTFAVSLGAPVVSMSMLFIIYGIEISSCVNNYFEYKGVRKRFNFWKLLGRQDVENVLEDPEKDRE
ncbi:MAG: phage holin family protein [Duncaniella sp.]|nr:phage holin family protein [Duncaniella sp.]MDE7145908.1 phage holin family protein [Duncaniella sp.]